TFHLRKKGQIEQLRAHQTNLTITQDDQPLGFDPMRSKIDQIGPLIFSLLAGPSNQWRQADMRLRISMKGGGIQKAEGEFPFLAPKDGYQLPAEATHGQDASREISHRRF